MPTQADFIRAGFEAAPSWGLEPTSIEVLSHSENVVLRVVLDDERQQVMRLHRPGYNTLDELNSEVAWVSSLAEAGLPVPTALPMVDGGHYRTIDVVASDGGSAEQRQVGMVDWIDGEPLGGPIGDVDDSIVRHYGTIGKLTAQVRVHNQTWTPPSGFVRRRWDADGFVGDNPLWGRFWDVPSLTAHQKALFVRTRDALRSDLAALSTGPDRFGLIHSDLHLGNLMADGDSLTLIDFDDSGFGWFAHELAIAINPAFDEPFYDDAKQALIDGYRTVFPIDDAELATIDTFLTVRTLMIVGWLHARPELAVHEHLPMIIDEAEEACDWYLSL